MPSTFSPSLRVELIGAGEQAGTWGAPTPMPTDGKQYTWDEATTSWVEVPTQE